MRPPSGLRPLLSLAVITAVCSCGGNDTLLANEQLSTVLAVSNVVKQNVVDPTDQSALVGLIINVDLVHTGLIAIDRPFDVTWTLLDSGGSRFATDTARVNRMEVDEVRRLVFTISFGSTPSLAGFRDGVTFDFVVFAPD